MTLQEQIINDIRQLPENVLQDLNGVVKRFLVLSSKEISTPKTLGVDTSDYSDFTQRFPLYGCAIDKIWMADDFDAPMEEMEEYM